ncbi:hypothetical protein ABK040_011411 [Willaertia magna]
MKLDCLISLYNYSDYNRNSLINELIYIKLTNINNEFITFFKNLFKEINLTEIELYDLINFIEENKELNDETKEEKIIVYKEIYKNTNDIEDLESLYELNENNKDIEQQLLSEYLKLNLLEKYLNLYIKLGHCP